MFPGKQVQWWQKLEPILESDVAYFRHPMQNPNGRGKLKWFRALQGSGVETSRGGALRRASASGDALPNATTFCTTVLTRRVIDYQLLSAQCRVCGDGSLSRR